MGKKNSLKAIIASFDFEEIAVFWNAYSEKEMQGDYIIHSNDEEIIDREFPKSSEFARASKYGHYDYEDKYFCTNKCGNLMSFNKIDDRYCPIDLGKLAEYLIENGDLEFPIEDGWLVEDFIMDYFGNPDESEKARRILNNRSESIDFLMEDWLDIYKEIKAHWND